jgi:zinc-ribbon domain
MGDEVMFCRFCGTTVPDDSTFCESCGKSLATPAPQANAAVTGAAPGPAPAPEPQHQTATSGPKFGQVFSTTGKVLLALLLISVGIGIVYAIISGVADSSGGSGGSHYDEWKKQYEEKNANEASTKVPKSQWDKEMKRCIRQHTVVEGMTKDEVRKAVGGDEPWTFTIVTRKGTDEKCVKFSGEKCVEYPPDEVKTFTLHFTPVGHLIWDDDSIGLSVYAKRWKYRENEKKALVCAMLDDDLYPAVPADKMKIAWDRFISKFDAPAPTEERRLQRATSRVRQAFKADRLQWMYVVRCFAVVGLIAEGVITLPPDGRLSASELQAVATVPLRGREGRFARIEFLAAVKRFSGKDDEKTQCLWLWLLRGIVLKKSPAVATLMYQVASNEQKLTMRLSMLFERNPIFHCLEGVHQTYNLRNVQLKQMGDGLVGVFGVWTPDSSEEASKQNVPFQDCFIFDPRTMTKWDLQTALWHRVEQHRKEVNRE